MVERAIGGAEEDDGCGRGRVAETIQSDKYVLTESINVRAVDVVFHAIMDNATEQLSNRLGFKSHLTALSPHQAPPLTTEFLSLMNTASFRRHIKCTSNT